MLGDPVNGLDPTGLKDLFGTASNVKNGVDAVNQAEAAQQYTTHQNAKSAIDLMETILPPWLVFDGDKTKDMADKLDNKFYKDCLKSGMGDYCEQYNKQPKVCP